MQETLSGNTKEMTHTLHQYNQVLNTCRELYLNKAKDYGTSWRMLRPISIVDQIYIKAWRIRQIQEKGIQKISDSVETELIGIVNYGIIALIQASLGELHETELTMEEALHLFDQKAEEVKNLMLEKNHDYGEAWREMSQQSFTDMILVKLLRIKQILANDGRTIVSEGIEGGFADIVNYAIFALIKMSE